MSFIRVCIANNAMRKEFFFLQRHTLRGRLMGIRKNMGCQKNIYRLLKLLLEKIDIHIRCGERMITGQLVLKSL